MLERLIARNRWTWAAFGKHPSARDYFQISTQFPLAQAFSQWVETGFDRLPEEVRRNGVCSWRFWSKGLKKSSLLCGLAKSSGDGVGRPYPLVLLGEGRLEKWETNWNLLPFVLASAWNRMEYSASRRIEDLGSLETDLQRMQAPMAEWKRTLHSLSRDSDDQQTLSIQKLIMAQVEAKARTLGTEQKLIVALDQPAQGDALQLAGAWHQALKGHLLATPSTVFMGGSLSGSFLVLFQRPLSAEDFIDLWSV